MEEKLRKILNEKMDGLSLQEALPDFDKAGAWEELSGRLQPEKQRVRPFTGWWSYAAAALVAGLLIGGLSVRYLQRSELNPTAGNPAIVRVTQKARQPVAQQPDTVMPATLNASPLMAAEQIAQQHAAINPMRKRSVARDKEATASSSMREEPLQQQDEAEAEVAAIPSEAPTMRVSPKRAIHLLDVVGEDKTVLINDAVKERAGPAFTLYISPSRLPGGRDAQLPASVLGPIIR